MSRIYYKTDAEVAVMKEGGRRLVDITNELEKMVKPGITTNEIDAHATRLIASSGGELSFATVPGYRWATCLPVNEQVVHTPPSERVLREGDLLTIDIGILFGGWHVDYATTLYVGAQVPPSIEQFLQTGREAVENAIKKASKGANLGELSYELERTITSKNYFILKDLTGHGIGHELHEEPYVYCYVHKPIKKSLVLQKGLTIAVEVMYSMGTEDIAHEPNNEWSIISKDRSLTACFEKSIAIGENNAILLT